MPPSKADEGDRCGGLGEGIGTDIEPPARPPRHPVAGPAANPPARPGATSARHAVAGSVDCFLGEVYSATPVCRHLYPDSPMQHRDRPGRGGPALAHPQRTALALDPPVRIAAPAAQRAPFHAPNHMSVSTTLKT